VRSCWVEKLAGKMRFSVSGAKVVINMIVLLGREGNRLWLRQARESNVDASIRHRLQLSFCGRNAQAHAP
jgi:hypothetical protein